MGSVEEIKNGIRNSRMFLNEVYFWTDTIVEECKALLAVDNLTNRAEGITFKIETN